MKSSGHLSNVFVSLFLAVAATACSESTGPGTTGTGDSDKPGTDSTAPTVSANRSGWYTVTADAAISATDAESGIAWTKYQWDTNDACLSGLAYTVPIPIPTGDGALHTLYMCAQNNAEEQGMASATMAVDTTVPLVSVDKSGWFNVLTDVSITSSDPESGIVWTRYEWDSDTACLAGEPYLGEIPIPDGDGTLHTLFMCAQNNAGTVGFSSETLGVDATAPTGVSVGYATGYTTSTSVAITLGSHQGPCQTENSLGRFVGQDAWLRRIVGGAGV